MKLEVGMYARLDGKIGKIIEVCRCEQCESRGYYEPTIEYAHGKRDYVSVYWKDNLIASHSIIDLIEEKDLVEIEYYSLRYNERVTRLFEVSFKDGKYINLSNAKCEFMLINGEFNEADKELKPIIKSIVTKEQFESCMYKVGE